MFDIYFVFRVRYREGMFCKKKYEQIKRYIFNYRTIVSRAMFSQLNIREVDREVDDVSCFKIL